MLFGVLPIAALTAGLSAPLPARAAELRAKPAASQRLSSVIRKYVLGDPDLRFTWERGAGLSTNGGNQALQRWARLHPLQRQRPFRENVGKHLWVSDGRGAIWETNVGKTAKESGRKIVGAIYDCANPLGIKVDHGGNLWATCAASGSVNMYAPGATTASLTLTGTYSAGPNSYQSIPDDVTVDAHHNVYVSNEAILTCTASSCTIALAPVSVYLAKASCGNLPCNNATPDKIISDPNANPSCPPSVTCFQEFAQTFVDLDAAGNLYEDYFAEVFTCVSSCVLYSSMIGLDVIGDPLGPSTTYTNLINGMQQPGGVYATNRGSVLNVLDEDTRLITRYDTSSFVQIGTLGPTPQDQHFGACRPQGFGFLRGESQIAAGDTGCQAVVTGSVPHNQFFAHQNLNYGVMFGAAFEPSDK